MFDTEPRASQNEKACDASILSRAGCYRRLWRARVCRFFEFFTVGLENSQRQRVDVNAAG